MKNGIINSIDIDNIFASEDRNLFFIPVSINVVNLTDDVFVSCFIKRQYYSAQSKPTHLSNSFNLSQNITFDQIKGSYDSLTRKLFSKNISIKSGQRELDNQKIRVNKNSNEIESTTIVYCPIKRTTLNYIFNPPSDSSENYSHVFSVYITNKENSIIETVSSGSNTSNPYSYLQKDFASSNQRQLVLDKIINSIKISITPFFHSNLQRSNGFDGKSLGNSGIYLTYNNNLLINLNKFFDVSSSMISLRCGDTEFRSSIGSLNEINFLLLREERFIANVLNKAESLNVSGMLDFEIRLFNSISDGDLVLSERIFQIEALKIKKIKQSFYAYYKNKHFEQRAFFDITQSNGNYIKIKINNSVIYENKELYTSLLDTQIIFKDTLNNSFINKLYFSKGSTKSLSTSFGFLFKNLVTKSFDTLYIKSVNFSNLTVSCRIKQLDLRGTPVDELFLIHPPSQENSDLETEETEDCDETEASNDLSDQD